MKTEICPHCGIEHKIRKESWENGEMNGFFIDSESIKGCPFEDSMFLSVEDAIQAVKNLRSFHKLVLDQMYEG